MFSFLKSDPKKKLLKQYEVLMKKAMEAQRNGKIDVFADLSKQADEIDKKIKALNEKS